jgi:hypothetical protein
MAEDEIIQCMFSKSDKGISARITQRCRVYLLDGYNKFIAEFINLDAFNASDKVPEDIKLSDEEKEAIWRRPGTNKSEGFWLLRKPKQSGYYWLVSRGGCFAGIRFFDINETNTSFLTCVNNWSGYFWWEPVMPPNRPL